MAIINLVLEKKRKEKMIEKSAKNVQGFFLWDYEEDEYFFRVYGENHEFTDYNVASEDIEVTINSNLSLYEDEDGNKLDYPSTVIKNKENKNLQKGKYKYLRKKERLDEMGVSFYVNEKRYAGWSYSGFGYFREKIASFIGINLSKMEGFTEIKPQFEFATSELEEYGKKKLEESKNRIKWDAINDPLVPFLNHSDCDGVLTTSECASIAPRLKELITEFQNQLDPYDSVNGLQLVLAMEEAAKTNSTLEFC